MTRPSGGELSILDRSPSCMFLSESACMSSNSKKIYNKPRHPGVISVAPLCCDVYDIKHRHLWQYIRIVAHN